jgi:type II secretory pathway component PulJ
MKSLSPNFRRKSPLCAGMTLVELLCATSVCVIALGAAFITLITTQRSLNASLYQVDSQGDENRVFAYMRRDLRGASSVQIDAQGTQLTVTIPAQTAPTFNLNLGLSLLSLLTPTQNAPTNTTIQYYRQGTSIIRELNGAPTELSSSATLFNVSLSGSLVQINAAFQPRYTFLCQGQSSASTPFTGYVHLLNTTAN